MSIMSWMDSTSIISRLTLEGCLEQKARHLANRRESGVDLKGWYNLTWWWTTLKILDQLFRSSLIKAIVTQNLDGGRSIVPHPLEYVKAFFDLCEIFDTMHHESDGESIFDTLCTTLPMI